MTASRWDAKSVLDLADKRQHTNRHALIGVGSNKLIVKEENFWKDFHVRWDRKKGLRMARLSLPRSHGLIGVLQATEMEDTNKLMR